MVFSLWTPYPKADETSVTKKKCGSLPPTVEQRLSTWLHEKQLLKTWLLHMICTFCCLLFPVLLTSRMTTVGCRAVCFHLAVTSGTANTPAHLAGRETGTCSAGLLRGLFSSWWQLHTTTSWWQRMQKWLQGYAQWLTGDANHVFPVVSQILGVRKEYRTLGFFKKSCTSLLLERLNICDRLFIHSI